MTINNEYATHEVIGKLSRYTKFYAELSLSMMGFVSQGSSSILNIDTYVYSSMQGTLESIKDILAQGRINDSYALLRKYYDVAIINIYSDLYLKDNYSLDNFVVQMIENWVQGKEKLPEYRIMSQYIRKSGRLASINESIYKDNTYKEIRDRCNSHTHYNFYYSLLLNDSRLFLKNRAKHLNQFSKDLENIFILHLSYLFYINDHYMMSGDYVDSLDCGITPEEGSQYFVAPFIQDIFDTVINRNRPDIASAIKANTSMLLN